MSASARLPSDIAMTHQHVLISGATSGIGLATALQLDQAGWQVYALAHPDDDFALLREQASERLVPLACDITDADAIAHAIAPIETLDALVNNAGIQVVGTLETLSISALQHQFNVNIIGHLQMIQALLPALKRAERARIVNVSSLMGKVALPVLGAYSMSKHALEAMSDVLRLELAPWGIDVIVIAPGAVQTPMTASMAQLLQDAQTHLNADQRADYAPLYASMAQTLDRQNASAVPAEQVATTIVTAIKRDQPQARYIIGAPTKGLMLMRSLAPDHIGDAILKRALGIKDS